MSCRMRIDLSDADWNVYTYSFESDNASSDELSSSKFEWTEWCYSQLFMHIATNFDTTKPISTDFNFFSLVIACDSFTKNPENWDKCRECIFAPRSIIEKEEKNDLKLIFYHWKTIKRTTNNIELNYFYWDSFEFVYVLHLTPRKLLHLTFRMLPTIIIATRSV